MSYALEVRSREFTQEFIATSNYCEWLFNDRFFPINILPPSFRVTKATIGTAQIMNKKGKDSWRMVLPIEPPDDKFTRKYFALHHPDALHDFLFQVQSLDLQKLLKQSDKITSYSLPLPIQPSEKIRGISDYLKLEADVTTDSWDFSSLVKLDVKQCYPSIYSHSLHWAIDGYSNVRNENPIDLTVGKLSTGGRGFYVDKSIQAMHGGITKGIAVGPGASDVIFEILFRRIDQEISEEFIAQNIDAIGGRFKDDYKILVKDAKHQTDVIQIVQDKLNRYLLHLNEDKTCFGHPFEVLQRDWMVEYHSVMNESPKNIKQLLWHLTYVADLQKRYPNKRLLAKYIGNLQYKPKSISEFDQITSVLFSLSDVFRSIVPITISYMDKIAEEIASNNIDQRILGKILREQNAYNGMWYLHYLATYFPHHKDQIKGKVHPSIEANPFWNSLMGQEDKLFSNTNVSASFFEPVDKHIKIYDQTRTFLEGY